MSDDARGQELLLDHRRVSASSVVSHTEPHHTPSAPRASAAAIWRPRAMPPAASTGTGATASTTSGTSTIVATSPVWPPASVPCATIRSTPAAACRRACCGGAGQRGDQHVVVVGPLNEVRRRRPERAGDQPDVVGEGDVEQRLVSLRRDVEPAALSRATARRAPRCRSGPAGRRGTRGAPRAAGPGLLGVDAALLGADVLGRQQQVDAVGLAAGLLLDPGQLDLQPLGAVRDRAEDAEAPGVGHRGDHVAAVAEGADRELNAEHLGDSGSHCPTLKVID